MRWSFLALGLVFGIPAVAQEVADTRAAELAKLRREVETMSQDLTLANEDLRSQLKAIEAQKVEIEVQIRREELRQLRRLAARAERGGPVLLDPDGCSPGGTPNWYLNQQRLERSRDGKRNPV